MLLFFAFVVALPSLTTSSGVKASAKLHAANGAHPYGLVHFAQVEGKTVVQVQIEGVGPTMKKHGFHVHELGDLSKRCDTAAGHYNPHGENHGDINGETRHTGDLGNVLADDNGHVQVNLSLPSSDLPLVGVHSIVGRMLVLHEGEDDLGLGGGKESLENGNAGRRLACGVIGYASDFSIVGSASVKQAFIMHVLSVFVYFWSV